MADLQYALVLLICLASIKLVRSILGKSRTTAKLPPSPRRIPIIGHMHLLGPIPHQAFHELSTRYVPLVYFFIGSKPYVLASSPEMVKEILKTNETNFLNRTKVANLHYLTYCSSDFATVPYGPHWKFMKKLFMTELLNGRIRNQLRPIRREETMRFLMLVMEKAEASNVIKTLLP